MNKDIECKPKEAYRGLPETEYLRKKRGKFVYGNIIMNLFVFFGWHWFSLAAAVFCGGVAYWFAKKMKNEN